MSTGRRTAVGFLAALAICCTCTQVDAVNVTTNIECDGEFIYNQGCKVFCLKNNCIGYTGPGCHCGGCNSDHDIHPPTNGDTQNLADYLCATYCQEIEKCLDGLCNFYDIGKPCVCVYCKDT